MKNSPFIKMTIFTVSKPTVQDEKAVEHADSDKNPVERKTTLSPRCVLSIVIISMLKVTIIVGIIVFFSLRSCRQDCHSDKTAQFDHDMDFERHGWFDDHRFSEQCHYDHDNDVLIMDLAGDGFGENATVVLDFRRGYLTYVLPSKNKCFLGSVDEADIESFKNTKEGEIVELGAIKPRNFTTTLETIPSAFLAHTTSPVVIDLCSSMNSHWLEPAVDDGDATPSRQKRDTIIVIVFSDGSILVIVRR